MEQKEKEQDPVIYIFDRSLLSRNHDTDAVVRATVTKFRESKTQVKDAIQSAGLEDKWGNMKHGAEGKEQDPVLYNLIKQTKVRDRLLHCTQSWTCTPSS